MFTIKKITKNNEIIVEPDWFFEGIKGNTVIIKGFYIPKKEDEYGYSFMKWKLNHVLLNKNVNIYSPEIEIDKIKCYIFLDDINIKNYFPEFYSKYNK